MESQRAARELKTIRQLMERPIRYSTMSGLSGILAGLAALAGCAADWHISQHYPPGRAVALNGLVWLAVFLVALTGNIVLTRLRERRQRMPFWSPVKRRILLTILPPFLVAVALTGVIVARWWYGIGPNQWGLIPALWMAFYGLALWQVGEFSVVEVRALGVAFLLVAVVAAMVLQMRPYLAMGVSFGGLHMVYGAIVWARYGG